MAWWVFFFLSQSYIKEMKNLVKKKNFKLSFNVVRTYQKYNYSINHYNLIW